jgi:glycosyltransferase involved in cell wall biosynthesis
VPKIDKILYIDAMALVPEKKSGIGLTIERTLEQLLKNRELKEWKIYLVVTLGKARYLKKYESANVHIKTIYLPARILEALSRSKLLPPIDWFLGAGVYVFPNYRNWPVWHSRSITYIYDVAYAKYPETVQIKNQKYLNKYMPTWVRRTDRVVTISNQVKYEIEKYLSLGESQIDIVPCGVDQAVFYKRDTKEIERVKNRYDIPYSKYFLFAGNIEPRKNLEKLLDAYDTLPASTQDEYGLVFVGGMGGWRNDTFYNKLKNMQHAKKNVFKVSDYVASTDLPALFSGATMLIHPAIYEGFGITPLEAMACEIPVVVSDLPAIREVVNDAGLYFDPNDTQAIASAINTTLTHTDLVTTNVALGLTLAKELSWKHTANELFKVISREQEQGTRSYPLLTRLRFLVEAIDRKIMYILGERVYLPYVPETILEDFISEQPTRLQLFSKKIYLVTKHNTFIVVKRAYHIIKAPYK